MNPSEYQKLAERTECDQRKAAVRMISGKIDNVRLNHSIIGMAGEVGELASLLQKKIYYGRDLDSLLLFKAELGDVLWYVAEACNALGLDMAEVMDANIRKLRERYPEKYTTGGAEDRDESKELKVISEGK